ncbi:hypothetical protein D3P07_01055 [Paenibacillus sp. 1011MAR3C5]|uniref:hypothetical protein n=1 Tax=Paenibacillus sp. 1011MAR3C5 TaxID=1675787 RepID=UPI000E6B8385|nr:hypothetical protein [Paenibacillus sp. 1011MAR3C5]RJE90724.1 hypothetical protein D3P07_01055 [Paenibacillus sp. 1011MAR3C5]
MIAIKARVNGELLNGFHKVNLQGAVAEGYWKNGLIYGHGTFTSPMDGEQYTGEWNNGKYHGFGRLTQMDGSYCETYWNHGEEGKIVKLVYGEMDEYYGEWKNGQPNGYGISVAPCGTWCIGHWVNGISTGKCLSIPFIGVVNFGDHNQSPMLNKGFVFSPKYNTSMKYDLFELPEKLNDSGIVKNRKIVRGHSEELERIYSEIRRLLLPISCIEEAFRNNELKQLIMRGRRVTNYN